MANIEDLIRVANNGGIIGALGGSTPNGIIPGIANLPLSLPGIRSSAQLGLGKGLLTIPSYGGGNASSSSNNGIGSSSQYSTGSSSFGGFNMSGGEFGMVGKALATYEEMGAYMSAISRPITEVVVHWVASYEDQNSNAQSVHEYHKTRKSKDGTPWKGIGYHFVICRDGTIQIGRNGNSTGAHSYNGHNNYSLGISFAGGYLGSSKSGKKIASVKSLNQTQFNSFNTFMKAFYAVWPYNQAFGHNNTDQRQDPGFDVPSYVQKHFNKTNVQKSNAEIRRGPLSPQQLAQQRGVDQGQLMVSQGPTAGFGASSGSIGQNTPESQMTTGALKIKDRAINTRGSNRNGLNTPPPQGMLNNINSTCMFAEYIFGEDCQINSAYRSPAYNRTLSGAAKNSYHMNFQALDISRNGLSNDYVRQKVVELRQAGNSVALGIYPTFFHIDNRGGKTGTSGTIENW